MGSLIFVYFNVQVVFHNLYYFPLFTENDENQKSITRVSTSNRKESQETYIYQSIEEEQDERV